MTGLSRSQFSSALQTLKRAGLITVQPIIDAEELMQKIQARYRVSLPGGSLVTEQTEAYVLSNDYGLSAIEIAQFQNPLGGMDDSSEVEVWMLLAGAQSKVVPPDERFARQLLAQRAYLYFYFLHFDAEHKEAAKAKTGEIRAAIGDDFWGEVLRHLDWSHHQILELGKGDDPA